MNLNSQSDPGKCKVYFAIAIGRGEVIQSLHSASKNSSKCNSRPLSTSLKRAQLFQLESSTQIQLQKEKTRDFISYYINQKIHTVSQTGPMKWNSIVRQDENAWKNSSLA